MSDFAKQDTPQTNGPRKRSDSREMQEIRVIVKDDDVEVDQQPSSGVIYRVHDTPPVYVWPIYGVQQAFMCVSGALSVPFLISSFICAGELPEVRAQLLSITFFMCGVATLLQNIIGIRLPIIQGASYAFLPPIVAMMQLDIWKCPSPEQALQDEEAAWKIRVREIQGNLLLASLTQVLLGGTGLVGLLLRFIGPVTIAPTIALIGLGFTSAVTDFAEKHWGVAIFTAGMVLVFSLWLGRLQVPIPSYSKENGCHVTRFPVFIVISVLLAVGCGWLLCFILTEADALPSNSTDPAYRARTDINLDVVRDAPWFKLPYPFQFGWPTASIAGFFGMFMATLSSILESMGDYYAAARVSGAPPPPQHAVNRGIAIEGISSVLSGLVGAGHATTSYSGNIAAIAVTRVASRRVFQTAGFILMLLGMLTKFGAVMTLIPDPVIGGLNGVLLGTLIAVGVSTLHYVDMDSPRNITVLGVTFMLGLAVPQWVNAESGRINTGTAEERGITKWQQTMTSDIGSQSEQEKKDKEAQLSITYDLPYVSRLLRRVRCCAYVPFLPSFNGFMAAWKSGHKDKPDEKAEANGSRTVGYANRTFDSESDVDFAH